MCCITVEVRDLGKPNDWPCQHLKHGLEAGCAIWGQPSRPKACAAFLCLWRASDTVMPPDLFPPTSGFLAHCSPFMEWPLTVNIAASRGRTGDWDTPANRQLFRRLARAWNCGVVCLAETMSATHLFTPSADYERGERPDLFPAGSISLPLDDFGPDRRPPLIRIRETDFRWDVDVPDAPVEQAPLTPQVVIQ